MLSDKKVEETDNLWKIACETLLFPRLFMIAIPFFIFTSLFFIPIDYGGITKFSKTMHGSYQNKWLFDLIFVFSIFSFINTNLSNIATKNKDVIRQISTIFVFKKDIKNIKYIHYISYCLYFISMNLEATNSTRFLMEYNRCVYINYFIYIVLFYYTFIIFGFINEKKDVNYKLQ